MNAWSIPRRRQALGNRALALQPSATLAVDARAKALIASGVDVVNLTAGEPDFPTPAGPSRAGQDAIAAGFTKYTPTAGIPELRAAIADKLREDNGPGSQPAPAVVSTRAKPAICNPPMAPPRPRAGGLTPAPCRYNWPSNCGISNDLTLAGGPDDVWILQIAGTREEASAKNVILTGGAQAKNVFWATAGAVSIGTQAHFEGTILSKTMVAMKTKASINGRLLAPTAVTLQMNTLLSPAL